MLSMKGHTLITDCRTGEVLYDHHNVITDFGRTRALELLGGIDTNAIDRMAVGDGGAPVATPSAPFIPLVTDTGLANELLRTSSINATTVGSNILQFKALFLTSPPLSFASALLKAVNEVGLFFADDNQPVPGTTTAMFARNTFPSIPFDTLDREGIFVTWEITIV